MMITNMKKKPIELYIHIPFCVKKCDYCDFLSFRALSSVHEAYVQQLIKGLIVIAVIVVDGLSRVANEN